MADIGGSDPSVLRRLNQAAVLRALRSRAEATLTELVHATGVARATVEGALGGLVERGLAVAVETAEPGNGGRRQVGRPARRYRFRAEAGCVVGLDIGVRRAVAVVADLGGSVGTVRRTALSERATPAERIAASRALAHRTLRGAGFGADRVRGVGVATTGVVAQGTVQVSQLLRGWAGTDVAGAFRAAFGVPVAVGNDASFATAGEYWRGAAAGRDDVLYVHVGRNISAGVLLGGRLHEGRNGAAGEIGVFGGSGWDTAPGRLWDGRSGPDDLFRAVAAGERAALRTLAAFTGDLARGIAAMVLTVDPELVVIGGAIARVGAPLLDPLRTELDRLCLFPVEVAGSTLGDTASALGGARRALDGAEADLFGTVASPAG